MTEAETLEQLNLLIVILTQAKETAEAIESEFKANGNDSLANIDFGATLNTQLTAASELFGNLDASGLFTMGLDN